MGILSHIPLDIVPHYDIPDLKKDVGLGLAAAGTGLAAVAMRGEVTSGILLGMVGGVLPDLENLFYHLGVLRPERRVFPTHRGGLLRHGAVRSPRNLVVQAAVGVAAILVMLR